MGKGGPLGFCVLYPPPIAALRATEQPINTATTAGKCFLDMLGVFAEFETNLRCERQLEGIAKSKAAGVAVGAPWHPNRP
jgi:DNA invertase Pin-like site-specific DNA recombinase